LARREDSVEGYIGGGLRSAPLKKQVPRARKKAFGMIKVE
jgi:hypothetical protein